MAKRQQKAVPAVVTIPGNGSVPESGAVAPDLEERVPIGEAMRAAVAALGDVVVDDSLAPSQLRQLAELHADVTRRRAAYEARKAEATTAKKGWESAVEMLLEQVRAFTHVEALPLFDGVQREADQAAMEAVAASGADVGEASL